MARQITDTEIRQLLELDLDENENEDVVFDESGAESDHVSIQHDSDDTEKEEDEHPIEPNNSDSDNSDVEMSQPLSNFARRSIYKGKDNTVWYRNPPSSRVRTRAENIITGIPGVKPHAKNAQQELDCFHLFVTESMLSEILEHTNSKIRNVRKGINNTSNEYAYSDTTLSELKAVIGLLFLAGLFKSGRQNLKDLWANDGTGIDIFRITMSLRRFVFIVNCMRFDNLDTREERSAIDKLAPIRYLFEEFVRICQDVYVPYENLTIDEELVAFRGRCGFRQYIPSKPAKYGIKIIALVDAQTYYSLKMEIYAGEQPDGPYKVSNKPHDIVDRIVQPISQTGRNVTMDNWFTSHPTFEYLLKNHKLTAVGTMKRNKACIPPKFQEKRDVNTTLFGFQKDMTILSYIPKRNKNVFMLSSYHHDCEIDLETGDQQKPAIITFYNQTKSGVDNVDKLIRTYDVSRNSKRWPLTIFFWILNTAGINAKIVHMLKNPGAIASRRQFIKKLGIALTAPHQAERLNNMRLSTTLRKRIGSHIGEPSEPTPKRPDSYIKKRCYLCPSKKNRKSKYTCASCTSHICLEHANFICENCRTNTE
ncbi:piggyBac transposable element-derived protein 4-like [Melitaea cinxia]|uniref:piggyBac transposable element-derived protein 4-like n=1 Tax=Melitaea cinxia TaxID=113334 RepID=UPI001E271DD3|nr:piggyBac transposable element-derived protein 4-like [Melitaea cinxia]